MPSPGELSADERRYLERARILGRRGWGHVHPNPMVGCVVVREGRVLAEGWHEAFGEPHAEVVALEAAGEDARGATAYVSLEPCAHHGKTPPCTEALVAAGVSRVVYGAADPGEESGGGGARLRREGIEVLGPVWSPREAAAENPAFFHAARREGPWIALKLATSLDGRIAAAPGERTRITGPEAEREVHRLRSGFDALMVGIGTAEVDDPLLTIRHAPAGRALPFRIVLDSGARLSPDAALLGEVEAAPVHVFTACDAPAERIGALEDAGASVHRVEAGPGGLSLEAVSSVCGDLGVGSVLCEGGARLAASLLASGLARRLYLFVAPLALGEAGIPAFGEAAGELPWSAFAPALGPELHGRDALIVYDRTEG